MSFFKLCVLNYYTVDVMASELASTMFCVKETEINSTNTIHTYYVSWSFFSSQFLFELSRDIFQTNIPAFRKAI